MASFSLNPEDVQVTSFVPGDGGIEPSDTTTETDPELRSRPYYLSCGAQEFTCGCGSYNNCTSPGYNC